MKKIKIKNRLNNRIKKREQEVIKEMGEDKEQRGNGDSRKVSKPQHGRWICFTEKEVTAEMPPVCLSSTPLLAVKGCELKASSGAVSTDCILLGHVW